MMAMGIYWYRLGPVNTCGTGNWVIIRSVSVSKQRAMVARLQTHLTNPYSFINREQIDVSMITFHIKKIMQT